METTNHEIFTKYYNLFQNPLYYEDGKTEINSDIVHIDDKNKQNITAFIDSIMN